MLSLDPGEVAQRVHVGTRVWGRGEAEERGGARDVGNGFGRWEKLEQREKGPRGGGRSLYESPCVR
jgi:hypothetical protein